MAHGLSCCVACGILPDQGSKLCLLNWQADSSSQSHQGSLISLFFFFSVDRVERKEKVGCQSSICSDMHVRTGHGFVLASMTLLWQEKMCVTEARISLFLTICLSELFTVLRRTIQISVTDITRTKDFTFIETFQRVTADVPTQLGTQVQFASLRIIFSD